MAKVDFKYKCENCCKPLGKHSGDYFYGLLLCSECLSIAKTVERNGKYDRTGAGFALPSA